jgi:ABC-type lipoprotein release transport system permease subunit
VPIAVTGGVLVVALVLVVFSTSVHGVETLMDQKRSIASLAALGASSDELERVQRWEIGLVAVPMAVLGILVGSAPIAAYVFFDPARAWIPGAVDAATLAVTLLAIQVSTRLTRPWLAQALAATNLRTG